MNPQFKFARLTLRFHDPEEEMELNCDVVPYLDDNVQLSIEDYRGKLYEASAVELTLLLQNWPVCPLKRGCLLFRGQY